MGEKDEKVIKKENKKETKKEIKKEMKKEIKEEVKKEVKKDSKKGTKKENKKEGKKDSKKEIKKETKKENKKESEKENVAPVPAKKKKQVNEKGNKKEPHYPVISCDENFDDDISGITLLSKFDELNANFNANEKECHELLKDIQSKIQQIINKQKDNRSRDIETTNLNSMNDILLELRSRNEEQDSDTAMLQKLMAIVALSKNNNKWKNIQKPTTLKAEGVDEDDVGYNGNNIHNNIVQKTSKLAKNKKDEEPPAVSDDEDEETFEESDDEDEGSSEESDDDDEESSEASDDEDEEFKGVSDDGNEDDIAIEEESYYNETIPIADLNNNSQDAPTLLVLPEPPKRIKKVRFNLPDLPPPDLDRDEFKDLSLFDTQLEESKIEDTEKECDDLFAKIRARFNQS